MCGVWFWSCRACSAGWEGEGEKGVESSISGEMVEIGERGDVGESEGDPEPGSSSSCFVYTGAGSGSESEAEDAELSSSSYFGGGSFGFDCTAIRGNVLLVLVLALVAVVEEMCDLYSVECWGGGTGGGEGEAGRRSNAAANGRARGSSGAGAGAEKDE